MLSGDVIPESSGSVVAVIRGNSRAELNAAACAGVETWRSDELNGVWGAEPGDKTLERVAAVDLDEQLSAAEAEDLLQGAEEAVCGAYPQYARCVAVKLSLTGSPNGLSHHGGFESIA